MDLRIRIPGESPTHPEPCHLAQVTLNKRAVGERYED